MLTYLLSFRLVVPKFYLALCVFPIYEYVYNMFDSHIVMSIRSECFRLNLSVVHNFRNIYYDISHFSSALIDFMLLSNFLLIFVTR